WWGPRGSLAAGGIGAMALLAPKRGTQSASFRAGLARPNLIDPLGPKSSCRAPAIHERPTRAERRLSFNQGIDPMAEVNSTVDEIEVSRAPRGPVERRLRARISGDHSLCGLF